MLETAEAEVIEERSTRATPLTDDDADALLAAVDSVTIARGRSSRDLRASDCTRDDLKGPTGGYRAPIVRVGDHLLVGFHAETLEGLLTEAWT